MNRVTAKKMNGDHMKKIIEYSVITAYAEDGTESLTSEVNSQIKNGWQPYGDLQYINDCWSQVMVKYEKPGVSSGKDTHVVTGTIAFVE